MSGYEVRAWPPEDWCAAVSPAGTHLCDLPAGHDGEHCGDPLPTVQIEDVDL